MRFFYFSAVLFLALFLVAQEDDFANKEAVATEERKKEVLLDLGVKLRKEGQAPFVSESEFKFPEKYQREFGDYKKWTRLTGYEFSGLHWNQFIVIYVNKDPEYYVKNYLEYAKRYLDEDDEDEDGDGESSSFIKYPVGTIFIKEHYLSIKGKPADAISTTIMKKRELGFDPENGDWEYWQFAVNGQEVLHGKYNDPIVKKNCAECHKNMEERDYVFATHSILDLKKK